MLACKQSWEAPLHAPEQLLKAGRLLCQPAGRLHGALRRGGALAWPADLPADAPVPCTGSKQRAGAVGGTRWSEGEQEAPHPHQAPPAAAVRGSVPCRGATRLLPAAPGPQQPLTGQQPARGGQRVEQRVAPGAHGRQRVVVNEHGTAAVGRQARRHKWEAGSEGRQPHKARAVGIDHAAARRGRAALAAGRPALGHRQHGVAAQAA